MLVSKTENPLTKVDLIDSISRLGVNYHFEHEIDEVMQQIYKNYVVNGEINIEANLSTVAVLFRLLRQHGFHVSPIVLNKFKNLQGNFNERLLSDVEGMLSLYEASHMMVHGEDILEEALTFTSTHLKSITTTLSPSLAAQVNHSLRQALHKNLPRLEARRYISIYEQDPSHNEILLTLAKLDFNKLQNLHKKEFGNICKWWKELDVSSKLPYVRDRIVECCFWVLAVYFEPQYSQARKILSKVFGITLIIDDTYDAYGTIDELELLTEAIERWDISCLDDLPESIKLPYKLLINLYEEIEQEMIKEEGKSCCIKYSIEEYKKLVRAYLNEARWFNNNYKPTIEEYLHASIISSGYSLMTITSYIGMGDMATENIFQWAANEPKFLRAISIVARLMDDIVSSEYKKSVRAYMTEAKWFNNNYKPTIEEYLHVSAISCGYSLMTITSYIGMGDMVTEDIFKWATNEPKFLRAISIGGRLMDDIASNEFEQKRGHVSSFLECYMNQYDESREAAIHECQNRIIDNWKDINEECLMPTKVPMPFLRRPFNLACFMDVFYKDEDNFTHSGGIMKTSIKALLLDPVPI
ncbi:probable terpene synthase 2 isoform X2 [Cajanus cajan]|uniref:probable terpene synthase 2 isoform X2 n=1 Tax=Cajanus cajan TaxID=3821 RepID=UPI00098DAA09|nr:probable terpene synthase 2 isoform X2 [Cajanus cajan]